jgi:hypothetical protein
MPKADEILSGLKGIANNFSLVAIAWHLVPSNYPLHSIVN